MLYTLTRLSSVATIIMLFINIQAAYILKGWLFRLLGNGYKSALYLWAKKQSGYKTLFSLLLNCIFLFLQLEVIILDLGTKNSFVKKGRISLPLT